MILPLSSFVRKYGKQALYGAAALGLGAAAAAALVSDVGSSVEIDDKTAFCTEFVPEMESSNYYLKWTKTAPLDNQKWFSFRTGICSSTDPLPPAMSTPFGRALVAAGKMALPEVVVPPTTSTTTTTEPPPVIPVLTSSLTDGDSVEQGTVWTITSEPDAALIEFWADDVKLAEDTSEPYETIIGLSVGTHQIGFCWTIPPAARTCNGVYGTITVTGIPPPPSQALWNGDWETGNRSQYGGVEFCGTFDGVPILDTQLKVVQSIDGVAPAQGNWFAKTILPPDQDPTSTTAKCYGGSSGSRVMLRQHDPIALRGEGYNTCITWATRFPNPGYYDEWVFMQWHQNGGQWPKPLDMDPGIDDINARVVIDKVGGGLEQKSYPFASPLQKNVWHVFVTCHLFSTGSGGKFDLWHGIKGQSLGMTKIVTHTGRTLMEPPSDKAHLVFGLYGPDSGTSNSWVYHDAAREYSSETSALAYANSLL